MFLTIINKPYTFVNTFCNEIDSLISILIFFSLMIIIVIFFLNQTRSNHIEKLIYLSIFSSMIIFMNIRFIVDRALLFILFFEINVLPIFFLIIYYSGDLEAILSSFYMIVINLIGRLPFLFFLGIIYSKAFRLSLDYLNNNIVHTIMNRIEAYTVMNSIFFFKLPLYFFHIWLPKAHVNASGACSIVLASLMLKLGVLGLIKFIPFFISLSKNIRYICCSLLGFTFLIFSIILLNFNDLKQIIAISSIVHISLIPICCYSYKEECFYSIVIICVGHSLVSSMLFYFVTLIYEQRLARSIDYLKSIDSSLKIINNLIVIYILINLGVPPLFSFLTEFYIMIFVYTLSLPTIILLIISMTLLIIILIIFVTLIMKNRKTRFLYYNLDQKFIYLPAIYLLMIFWLPILI